MLTRAMQRVRGENRAAVGRRVPKPNRARAILGLLVFACSVYDKPPGGSDVDTQGGGGGGGGATAGTSTDAPTSGSSDGAAGTAPSAGSGEQAGTGATSTGGSSSPTGGAGGTQSAGDAGKSGSVTQMPDGAAGEAGAGGAGGAGGMPPEVVDHCPNDPKKLEPGTCGCGLPDTATTSLADCKTLKSKLLHRYDFEGTGTTAKDRIGTADGTVKGATLTKLDGKGVVLLGGGTTGPYVDLPNKLVSPLTNATLEAWITWGGGNDWQRVFDFGDSDHSPPEDNPAAGKTYIFLTPRNKDGVAAGGYSANGYTNQALAAATTPLSSAAMSHVALVVDDAGDKLVLYVDGKSAGTLAWTGSLSTVNDVNAWLGRSQFDGDPELSGVYHEFRIYGAALSAAELATSFTGGPDPSFLAY